MNLRTRWLAVIVSASAPGCIALAVCGAVAYSVETAGPGLVASTRATAWLKQGQDAYAKGDLNQAIAAYDKAIDLDPKSAQAYYERANAYSSPEQF